jgi:hypothetical protein
MRHVEAILSPEFSVCMEMVLTRSPRKERGCVSSPHVEASHVTRFLSVERIPSCHLSISLGSQRRGSFILSPSDLFGPLLPLIVEQLVLPAQILPDWGHSLVAQQFL